MKVVTVVNDHSNWWIPRHIRRLKGTGGIYIFQNKLNKKVYIGQASDLYKRYINHIHSNSQGMIISKSIRKNGISNFTFKILEPIKTKDKSYFNKREKYWIDFYRSWDRDIGYNIQRIPNSTKGRIISEETRKKISKINKGVVITEQRRMNILLGQSAVGYAKTVEKLDNVGNVIDIFISISQASKMTGIPRKSISSVANHTPHKGNSKTKVWYMKLAGGFNWRFAS